MTCDELREKVKQVFVSAVLGGMTDNEAADAAIALARNEALEEAATMYWIHRDGKAEDIHAAIRALKEGK